ncbi:MAG: hypothetical protein JXQ82_07680 [Methanomicrobiaceae archaeon]|nr:hypothetical protein [Methanomicrobiaceae archaeon]
MALTGFGKLTSTGKAKTKYLSIPSKIVTDSAFPFETGEQIKITLDAENKRLIIEKIK